MASTIILDVTSLTATKTFSSALVGLVGSFAALLDVKNADRGSANETYDFKIQESPDPMPDEVGGLSDADATWFDIVTFTQVAATSALEKKTAIVPWAWRLRVVATLAGTTPSCDAKITLTSVGE